MNELTLTPVEKIPSLNYVLPKFLNLQNLYPAETEEETSEEVQYLKTLNLEAKYPYDYFEENINQNIYLQHLIIFVPLNIEYVQYNGKTYHRGSTGKFSFFNDGQIRILHMWKRDQTESCKYSILLFGYLSQSPENILNNQNREAQLNALQKNTESYFFSNSILYDIPLVILKDNEVNDENEKDNEDYLLAMDYQDIFEEF